MTRDLSRIVWSKYLRLASNPETANRPVPNPLRDFEKKISSGRFRHLDSKNLANLRQSRLEESELFQGEPEALPGDILLRALQKAEFPFRTTLKIAGVMADASSSVHQKAEASAPFMDIPDSDCDELPFFTDREEKALKPLTPRDIFSHLSKSVFGQEDAKRALSMLVYHHLSGRASNLLIAGPTGSGKSALIESLTSIPNLRVTVLDGSRLVAEGYKGSVHLTDAFPPDMDGRFILCIDEADKAFQHHESSNGTRYDELIMNQFLLLLDHKKLTFSPNSGKEEAYEVDTSKTSVILLGAWENLMKSMDSKTGGIGFGANPKVIHTYSNTELSPDDYIAFGVRKEIIGRITDFVMLNPISASDFRRILDAPGISPIDRIADEYRIELTASAAFKDYLAEKAYSSGLGCRTIYAEIKRRLNNIMFADCYRKHYHFDAADPITNYGTRSPAQAIYANADH